MKTFKIARIKKDLTQRELGELLNMSPATINKIENGVKPIASIKVGDLIRICKVLDIPLQELLDNKQV